MFLALLCFRRLVAALAPWWDGFNAGPDQQFLEAMGQTFSRVLRFCTASVIPLTFHTNPHYQSHNRRIKWRSPANRPRNYASSEIGRGQAGKSIKLFVFRASEC